MAEFKVGDIVRLKSSLTVMTVSRLPGDPTPIQKANEIPNAEGYECIWLAGSKQHVGRYPADVLEPAEPPAPRKG